MRHWSCIFIELASTKTTDIFNPVDRLGVHVARELLVAKDCQAFLQGQLEPIAARYTVTGPVVKVLVPNDTFD